MRKNYTIYGLRAKGQSRLFYIGLTSNLIQNRLAVHISHAKSGKETNAKKIEIMKGCDYEIAVFPLETGINDRITASKREKYWIEYLLSKGHPLTNKYKPGGSGNEKDIINLISLGFSTKQIGRKLGLNTRTTEGAIARIRKELGAKTLCHLVAIAHRKGIIQ